MISLPGREQKMVSLSLSLSRFNPLTTVTDASATPDATATTDDDADATATTDDDADDNATNDDDDRR